jgi:hypothetical protein
MNEIDIVLFIKSNEKYNDELFFNRKKRYVLNLCAMCDSNKKFIYYLIDWFNSQHDQRIFAAENLHRNLTNYFLNDQYLLNDSAYINIIYVITVMTQQ